MIDLRNRIVAAAFETEGTVFAQGQSANNKLNAEAIRYKDPELYDVIIDWMAQTAKASDAKALLPVPSGAVQFAHDTGRLLDIPVIGVDYKEPRRGGRTFYLGKSLANLATAAACDSVFVLEDVTNTRGSLAKVACIPMVRRGVIGGMSIWRRGTPQTEVAVPPVLEQNMHWLVEEPLPDIMSPEQIAEFQAVKDSYGVDDR